MKLVPLRLPRLLERASDGALAGRASISKHSKSFAMCSWLLPAALRARASILYGWCRRADDAVDAVGADAPAAVARLRAELARIYAGARLDEPILRAFADVVREAHIPRCYPEELLMGMAMDADGHVYQDERDLRLYCFRVAGVVGLMMCHVTGLDDVRAQNAAARLGVAMQLTNICRDVREDWERGRLYLPRSLLHDAGCAALASRVGGPLPAEARRPLSRVISALLERAEGDYAAGDLGMAALPLSCRPAIGAARRIYAAIGDEIALAGHDPFAPRAHVPARRKLRLAAQAVAASFRSRVGGDYRSDMPVLTFEEMR